MTNRELLDTRIAESGYKKSYIAKTLGVTAETLSRKIRGVSSFNVVEMKILCELLGIDDLEERRDIFFADK